MKNYVLVKRDILGINMKKLIYDFKLEKTNLPTKWIKIIVHHTGNKKTLQQIIELHVKKNNWTCIGYHFLIGKNGQIYYARELNVAGAHTYAHNRNSIGIALFGNFDEIKPSDKQIASLKELIKTIKKEYKIRKIYGHNQAIYKLIKDKFFKIDLPDINPLEISSKPDYENFIKETSTKILENDATNETIELLKKLKSCPGFNNYKHLIQIQKENK